MSKFDDAISAVETVITQLNALRGNLREMKDESEEVEKARDKLRGRRRPRKDNGGKE